MANSQLSRVQILNIGKFMESVINKASDGYVAYVAGWDDLKVAHKFNCTEANIVRLRKDLFGKFLPGGGPTPMAHVWERIATLEARIAAIEARERPSISDRYNISSGHNGLSVTSKT